MRPPSEMSALGAKSSIYKEFPSFLKSYRTETVRLFINIFFIQRKGNLGNLCWNVA